LFYISEVYIGCGGGSGGWGRDKRIGDKNKTNKSSRIKFYFVSNKNIKHPSTSTTTTTAIIIVIKIN